MRPGVLVIFPGALGDLICLGPSLGALARRHRGYPLELMARWELAQFAPGRTAVADGQSHGHSLDRAEVALLFRGDDRAVAEAAAFFGRFAQIYSFFASNDSAFRRSLRRAASGPVTFLPFRPPGSGHVAAAYLRELGEPAIEPSPALSLKNEDRARAAEVLALHSLRPGRFVLIIPGSGGVQKNWPAEGYLEVARSLGRGRAAVLLGPSEEGLRHLFEDAAIPTMHGLPLEVAAALAAAASRFVGNDSGMSHLAAAVGTPGLVLFGPTDAERWRPLGRVRVLERRPLADLTAEEVAAELRGLPE